VPAQSSNRVWFVTCNGAPTPSSDISVQSLLTAGGAVVAAGSASNFVSQVSLPALNSPYDVAVDLGMGKVYVLDNNLAGGTPAYIYSFNLSGTPAQVAASKQILYTMPVPSADVTAGLYPLISGIALDAVNHRLYFNQIDVTTSSNSFIGCLELAGSARSNAYNTIGTTDPVLHTCYVGQIPGQGPIALGGTNIYLGAINGLNGNNGVYQAPLDGRGAWTEIVTVSAGDTLFGGGLVAGVAADVRDNLVYFLTYNAGAVNYTFDLGQNALWTYNLTNHNVVKIASGYAGYPGNLALDVGNNRYYFTVGQDGTGKVSPTNYQAIYTGILGVTNAPTWLYTPVLSGQDTAGNLNAGSVALHGIYVVDISSTNHLPVTGICSVTAVKNQSLRLPVAGLLANDYDLDGDTIALTAVSASSTNGGSVGLSGSWVVYTPLTNFIGRDQFTYTLTDGQGGQTQGTVVLSVVSVATPATNHLAIQVQPGSRLIFFAGAASQNYVVQCADSLTGPWQDLSPSLMASATGFVEYNDLLMPPAPVRFYRIRPAF